ncbi:MAG: hypothetical protein V3V26_01560, partial [Candidatus Aenigmarchaeota archaeon]
METFMRRVKSELSYFVDRTAAFERMTDYDINPAERYAGQIEHFLMALGDNAQPALNTTMFTVLKGYVSREIEVGTPSGVLERLKEGNGGFSVVATVREGKDEMIFDPRAPQDWMKYEIRAGTRIKVYAMGTEDGDADGFLDRAFGTVQAPPEEHEAGDALRI